MPIKPENKALYPPNWKTEIRPAILGRAKHRCEACGVHNYAVGWRDKRGEFQDERRFSTYKKAVEYRDLLNYEVNAYIVIVLTIAHLDHDPTNNDPSNLRALCQRCHNRYDRAHRQVNAARTRQERVGSIHIADASTKAPEGAET